MQNSWFLIVWESHQNCSMGPFDGALPGSWQDSHRQRMEYHAEYIDYIITMRGSHTWSLIQLLIFPLCNDLL